MTYAEKQTQFFQDFYAALEKAMKKKGASLQEIDVPKNNAIKKRIAIQFDNHAIGVTVYPESFYSDFLEGIPLKDIISHLEDELVPENQITIKDIQEMARDNADHYLRTAIVNYEGNKEWLKNIPHERVADLAVFGKWDFGNGCSVKVTDALLAHLQLTKEEMLKIAKNNMAMHSCLLSMKDVFASQVLYDGMPEKMAAEIKKEMADSPFLILSVDELIDGAALIADSSVMKKVSREIEEDYYILPSSIHEVLILPKSIYDADKDELRQMVQSVNLQEVPVEDRLSDNVYEFDGHRLRLAGQTETMDKEMPALDMGMHHKR